MTSVVDTSVKFFTSDMPGAPSLTYAAGTLLSVLSACLVDGFGLKTATSLSVASGVATLALNDASLYKVGSVILVAGSSIAALNGEQKITAVAAGVVKFATEAADGAASGTVTMKMAPLGWEKPFADGNKAVFRSLDIDSPRFPLRVDDSDSMSARVRGYEALSTIDVGSNPFPSDAQVSSGGYWGKAVSSSAPAPWAIIGDGRTFFYHCSHYASNGASYAAYTSGSVWGFGDMLSDREGGDPYACTLAAGRSSGWSGELDGTGFTRGDYESWCARALSGAGGSYPMRRRPLVGSSDTVTSGMDTLFGTFPSPVDGRLLLSEIVLRRTDLSIVENTPRVRVPGVRFTPQTYVAVSLANQSFVVDEDSGRTYLILHVSNYSSNLLPSIGAGAIDVTGPWR